MNYLKTFGLAAIAAMAMTAFTAGTASATTLEIKGVVQNAAVAWSASLEPGTSALLQLTNGSFLDTCTVSSMSGSTTTFSAESSKPIGGPISVLSYTTCTNSPVVVDAKGSWSVEWISGTTNGTVKSFGTEVTTPSPIGNVNCKTGAGVDIGTLTGKSGSIAGDQHATLDISAVLNCGFLAPSATWTAKYLITSPTGLGVVK
jgi:hypothetical protein